MLATQAPFPLYLGLDGGPLDGTVFFGVADDNPETAPITVYWDSAGTQPASQPVTVSDGRTMRNGNPALVYANGDYSLLLRDRKGRTVFYSRSGLEFAASLTLQAQIEAFSNIADVSKGDALVGVALTDAGAQGTTEHEVNERRVLEAFDFMTSAQIADVCSAAPALDHTAAVQAAITAAQLLAKGERRLRINSTLAGHFRITAPLVISGNYLTIEWDSNNAVMKKFFNGDLFQVSGGEVELVRCGIDGNGATYTGAAIRLMASNANSFRMLNPRIVETADSPVLIEADAGSLMKLYGGLLQPHNASASSVPAVKCLGTDTGPKARKMIGISTGGAPIADCSGAETFLINACDGSYITSNASSKKIIATGNRMGTGGINVAIYGIDHAFVGNIVASSLELMAGATNCTVRSNTTAGGFVECIDGSGNTTNKVSLHEQTYTPAWTATGTAPAIGNGTIAGYYSRQDKMVEVHVVVVMGSTTTFGTGTYSFSLPYQSVANHQTHGSAYALDSGGTGHYSGVAKVGVSATTASVYYGSGVATQAGQTVPFTWANGDQLIFTVRYPIA